VCACARVCGLQATVEAARASGGIYLEVRNPRKSAEGHIVRVVGWRQTPTLPTLLTLTRVMMILPAIWAMVVLLGPRPPLPWGGGRARVCVESCLAPLKRQSSPPLPPPPTQEYEVCFLKTEPEAPGSLTKVDHKWSVWHRYSDFEELDK
jgi:hypothetical protein